MSLELSLVDRFSAHIIVSTAGNVHIFVLNTDWRFTPFSSASKAFSFRHP